MAIELPVKKSGFLKASDFDKTMVLLVAKAPVYKPAAKFADDDGNSYFYFFQDSEGHEYEFQSNSVRFASEFNDAQCEIGDVLEITGKGQGMQRTYTITKLTREGAESNQAAAGAAPEGV